MKIEVLDDRIVLDNVKIYMDEQGYRWSCKHCRGMGWGYPSREQVVQRAALHWQKKHL